MNACAAVCNAKYCESLTQAPMRVPNEMWKISGAQRQAGDLSVYAHFRFIYFFSEDCWVQCQNVKQSEPYAVRSVKKGGGRTDCDGLERQCQMLKVLGSKRERTFQFHSFCFFRMRCGRYRGPDCRLWIQVFTPISASFFFRKIVWSSVAMSIRLSRMQCEASREAGVKRIARDLSVKASVSIRC